MREKAKEVDRRIGRSKVNRKVMFCLNMSTFCVVIFLKSSNKIIKDYCRKKIN